MPEIIHEMRAEAAAIGCDGVIITDRADIVRGHEVDGTGSTGTLEGFMGTCIVWTECAPPLAAPEGPDRG
jgi:hypothetical protein